MNVDTHRAVDQIAEGWRRARIDLATSGLKARTYDGPTITAAGHSDPTGDQAVNIGHAVAYTAELHAVTVMFLERAPDNPQRFAEAMHHLFRTTPTGWAPNALQRLWRLADRALAWWPDEPKHGDTVAGVTIGARGNTVELCGLCLEPVAGGHGDPIRRIDGQPFHGKSCYYTVWRQRKVKTA